MKLYTQLTTVFWQHITGELLSVVQDKTGEYLKIPFHPKLATAIAKMPRTNMTFLLTEEGAPFTAAALTTGLGIAAVRLAYSIARRTEFARPAQPV